METCKHGLLLENAVSTSTSDDLHTPQMVFPTLDAGDATLYTSNNKKNITISRSSSDESGTIKEYETTTISKLTNQVTTISRIVNKLDTVEKSEESQKGDDHVRHKDVHNERSVSYTNNIIKIQNNIEIRKDNLVNVETTKSMPSNRITYDTITKETSGVPMKDVLLTDSSKTHENNKLPPIMSQKSLDFVVDSLTSEICQNHNGKPVVKMRNRRTNKILPKATPATNVPMIGMSKNDSVKNDATKVKLESKCNDDYEVTIKLPNGKRVRMKAVDESMSSDKVKKESDAKEKLKNAINNKVTHNNLQRLHSITAPIQSIVPIAAGTLIPVTIINPTALAVPKIPIPPFNPFAKPSQEFKKTVKRKIVGNKVTDNGEKNPDDGKIGSKDDDCAFIEQPQKKSKENMDSRVAASRRYRVRLRETMKRQVNEIKQLREANQRLATDKAVLQVLITEHMKTCPNADDFSELIFFIQRVW
ncbi:unnamed protein product [Diatraea saccharalis]|uniref:BZIP domain-containing protein n=1 Tax=Diatraea saccharalis TaxID=40085 RepID=A0A9N9WIE0_9NEOP|nr:unnamed protein product [Diatraea saccharalis]